MQQIKNTKTYKPYLDGDQGEREPVTLVGVSFARFKSNGKIDWVAEETAGGTCRRTASAE